MHLDCARTVVVPSLENLLSVVNQVLARDLVHLHLVALPVLLSVAGLLLGLLLVLVVLLLTLHSHHRVTSDVVHVWLLRSWRTRARLLVRPLLLRISLLLRLSLLRVSLLLGLALLGIPLLLRLSLLGISLLLGIALLRVALLLGVSLLLLTRLGLHLNR